MTRLACIATGALALFCVSPLAAHDFWIEPATYQLIPDTPTPMTLQVGHGPSRQRTPIPIRRIVRFAAIAPGGTSIDLRKDLHIGDASEDGRLRFASAGTYLLVLATDNRAQSHLPAIRFNDYLEAEGLTPALEQRRRTQRMDTDGAEIYSRQAKSIVQVGAADARAQTHVTQPLGLPLEIVPELDPYALPRGSALPVRVIYRGAPLAGALVKLTNLEHDDVPFEMHRTGNDGRASFAMPAQGRWLLNVIWTRPIEDPLETADFETIFSSLSFGFSARPNDLE